MRDSSAFWSPARQRTSSSVTGVMVGSSKGLAPVYGSRSQLRIVGRISSLESAVKDIRPRKRRDRAEENISQISEPIRHAVSTVAGRREIGQRRNAVQFPECNR